MKKLTQRSLLFALMVLLLCFSACKSTTQELSLVLTEADFAQLEEYPRLQKLDLTGSTCYAAIEQYIAAHPEVEVTYTVFLGSRSYDPQVTELTLAPEEFDFTALMETLPYLSNVSNVSLPGTALTAQQLDAFRAAFPHIRLEHSVAVLGELYSPDTTELALSSLTGNTLSDTVTELQLLPGLVQVELMDENGQSQLSPTEVKVLQDAFPQVFFHYSFDLFGQTVSTDQESVVYLDTPIGSEGEQQIREALDILQRCTYFKLDDCGIDSETMAGIRDDYPNVKVVWRIYCGNFTMCTDETMVRMTHRLDDTNCSELQYCTDVTYMDIGQNESLTDISFVANMPKLECVIVSGAPVEDISYFADHQNLQWLELCYCGHLKDISVLKSCSNLKYLNISYTRVSNLSALEHLPLERFSCMNTRISGATQADFESWHPDCLSRFTGKQPYGYGWRYIDNGVTYNDYYANMRIVFRYDDENYHGNRKER